MSKIKVVGAIASKTGITLYLDDGKEMNLANDSFRTQAILDEVLKPLARKKTVAIDLDDFSVERRIEQKSGGFIKFLRNTAAKIGSALGITHDGGVTEDVGAKPGELVAVVGGKQIPVDALEKQMERAAFGDNMVGFQKFLERLAGIIDQRGHTVNELLNFMKRGDLPIANDGSIIAYKVLRSKGGHFVDCHSGNVLQRVGSHVSMDEKLVDPSKRTECSSGLHIARRGYLRSFGGDIITLVKIAPEDVIAVPNSEPNKMRVAAYHVVAVLPANVHEILRSDRPMTSDEKASKILADVIAGNHIGIVEYVRIGSAYGGDLRVTPADELVLAPKPFQNGKAKALDEDNLAVSVKEIRKAVDEAVQEEKVESARERANRRKREKRAAEKAAREAVQIAPTAPPAKKERAKSAFTEQRNTVEANIPDNYARALHLVQAKGMSIRAAERETGVSARTIGRLLKNK